jgi:lipooligosaccharide transport system permease protein
MTGNNTQRFPPLHKRLYSVWFRHMRVYTRNIFSNAFPPFFEPLIFLAGIGMGLGNLIEPIDGQPYIAFLAIGLLVTSSMWTAFFECTFGTFIRLEFQKVYDGILAAPITANDLIIGELLWAGSKGFFFTLAVLVTLTLVSLLPNVDLGVPLPQALAAPFIGFVNALMFASMALLITSFVKTINHFNFFMTGLISPMFFFAGVVFPIDNLPKVLHPVAELMPLTHSVRILRCICDETFPPILLWDAAYIVVFTAVMALLAIYRLKKRLIK